MTIKRQIRTCASVEASEDCRTATTCIQKWRSNLTFTGMQMGLGWGEKCSYEDHCHTHQCALCLGAQPVLDRTIRRILLYSRANGLTGWRWFTMTFGTFFTWRSSLPMSSTSPCKFFQLLRSFGRCCEVKTLWNECSKQQFEQSDFLWKTRWRTWWSCLCVTLVW